MNSFLSFIKEKLIIMSIGLLGLLIAASFVLSWYNKQKLVETARVKAEAEQVKYLLGGIFERTLRSIDLGIRGYALTTNSQMLSPYDGAVKQHPANMKSLDSLLLIQKLDTSIVTFGRVKMEINNYLKIVHQMKEEITGGRHEEFMSLLNQDKGYDAWRVFEPFYNSILRYENNLIVRAQSDYEKAMNRNLMVQIILLILGVAILIMIATRLRKESKLRSGIFLSLHESNHKYLFHPGHEENKVDQSAVIQSSISNFKKASTFISSIANGNYNASWEGLHTANQSLNQHTLAGQLHLMRDKLIRIREDEEKRNWANVGLAQYSEVVRKFQNNLEALCFESVRFMVTYIKAQQGGVFLLDESDGTKGLSLAACFAFDRKKYVDKKIDLGYGLVGQTFLEGVTVTLTQVPEDYPHITSGLGHSRPKCIVIVPMKHNEEVIAVFEVAALQQIAPEQIKFIEKCGEFLADALKNAQTNEHIKKLLHETQLQAESMKSQEEEMRQNMEELSATQEEMLRKEKEYLNRLGQLENN